MSSELDRELKAKRAQAKSSNERVEPKPTAPQNPVFESLGEFQPSAKPVIRADYESFGFGKLLIGVLVLFLVCASLTALAVMAQVKLKLPNHLGSHELGANGKPGEEEAQAAEPALAEASTKMASGTHPEKSPNPFVQEVRIRLVRIGEMPPSVSPAVPESIGKPFTSTPITESEAVLLADKVVAAVNNNSSKDLVALMDAEVMGNYLFEHADLTAEKRFQLGSETLELFGNHSRLSEQLPDAQAFPPIQMGQSTVPLIRVSSNAYGAPFSVDAFGFGPMVATTSPSPGLGPGPGFPRASNESIKEYERIRKEVHNQQPIRFRPTTNEERWRELRFQRTPLNMLLDHPAMYFAVIATRNRAGKPVLLDLACINKDTCLLEATWNSIDENTEKKSFSCSRPPNQTEKYFNAFRESVGDKTTNDIFKSNFAFKQVRITKNQVCVVTGFLEESKMTQPSPDDCLDALEDLERLFPNDTHNVMLQYIVSRDAKFAKEAGQLFDRLVKMKYRNISFYDDAIDPYRWIEDGGMARKIVDAFKENCLR